METTNQELLEKYMKYLKQQRKVEDNTIKIYYGIINNFFEFVNNKNIDEINEDNIIDYIFEKENFTDNTNLNRRTGLKLFFNWLKEKNYIEKLPIEKDKWPKISVKKSRDKKEFVYIDEEKLFKILAYLKKDLKIKNNYNKTKLRDLTIFCVIYYTGFRREETIQLQVEDFNFNLMNVKTIGKGSKERTIPYCSYLNDLILQYLKEMNIKTGYIFPSEKINSKNAYFSLRSVNKIYEDIYKATGIHVHPHMGRKTFATNLLNDGTNLQDVRDFLGHSSIETTAIYVPKRKGINALRKVMDNRSVNAFVKIDLF